MATETNVGRTLRTPEDFGAQVREGVRNLVENCAEVEASETIVLVNDGTRIDTAMSATIEEAIQRRHAKSAVLWVEPLEGEQRYLSARRRPFTLSPKQAKTLCGADRVIVHADAEHLIPYLADASKKPLIVQNRSATAESLAASESRYPWGIADAIHEVLNHDIFLEGARWRITAPNGTDIHGAVPEPTLRASYFEDEVGGTGVDRSFHSSAYLPVGSADAEGIIVVEWMDGTKLNAAHDPAYLEIGGNRMKGIAGGLQDPKWLDDFWSATQDLVERFGDQALVIDSWHSGTHPQTTSWAGGTRHLHFHLGRTTGKVGDFVWAGIKYFTLTVNDQPVSINGRLAILDHPKVRAAAERYNYQGWREAWPASNHWQVGSA